ncbi:MAG TPA: A24 family peptidase [Bryobacteraceae bacterium]|jgi:prepilin peptidase CpaA|nr:A24 family peptidase [Bryobacteraceae bacterium]
MLRTLPWTVQVLLAVVVLIASYYDIRYRRIPNWLTLPCVLVGFALNAFLETPFWHGLGDAGLAVALALLLNFPLYLLHARGAGDVKMLAAVGALVGWRDWVAIFILSGILGGVLALILMLGAGRFRKTLRNVGSIVGEMLHFRAPHLKSEEFDVKSPLSFRLPQGAVIALGCCLLLGLQAFLR